MARVKLDFGAEVDLLNRDELRHEIDHGLEQWRQYAYGLKYMRRKFVLGAASGGVDGPRQGFAWMLTLASVNVSAAATVGVYLGDDTSYPLAAPVTTTAAGPVVFGWSSRQVILMPGERVYLTSSAGVIGRGLIAAVEAPSDEIYKLIGG